MKIRCIVGFDDRMLATREMDKSVHMVDNLVDKGLKISFMSSATPAPVEILLC